MMSKCISLQGGLNSYEIQLAAQVLTPNPSALVFLKNFHLAKTMQYLLRNSEKKELTDYAKSMLHTSTPQPLFQYKLHLKYIWIIFFTSTEKTHGLE